ncbi:MAG TPA: enoyl-CoA hydratase/isomerase family protein, partial [Kofleriaceae bacterium]|nr:enoyl-CoA hydratase/isomerase family protein [Kofleriaceae bacterium]
MYATILVTESAPVARITLNRPEKRNPIGPATCGELVAVLAEIKARPELRVVVLTGAGTVFSAGGDLAGMHSTDGPRASLVDLLLAM